MKKFLVVAAIIVLAISLYFGINYLVIQKHIKNGEYDLAKPYYDNMFYSEDTGNQYYHIANTSYYGNKGDYYNALVHLNKIDSKYSKKIDPSNLLKYAYSKAKALYEEGDSSSLYESKKLFKELEDYERSADYLTLLKARDLPTEDTASYYLGELLNMLDFADTKSVIVSNHELGVAFLKGEWKGPNNMSFQITSNGRLIVEFPFSMPYVKNTTLIGPPGGSYEISDGDFMFGNAKWIHIELINENMIEINDFQRPHTFYKFRRVN